MGYFFGLFLGGLHANHTHLELYLFGRTGVRAGRVFGQVWKRWFEGRQLAVFFVSRQTRLQIAASAQKRKLFSMWRANGTGVKTFPVHALHGSGGQKPVPGLRIFLALRFPFGQPDSLVLLCLEFCRNARRHTLVHFRLTSAQHCQAKRGAGNDGE